MKVNLQKIQRRLKRLQLLKKEAERLFLMEIGKATIEFLREASNSGKSVDELKERVEKIYEEFGKEVDF